MQRLLTASIGLLFFFLFTANGCYSDQKLPPTSVLASSDGKTQVNLPSGWKEDRELHDTAELQASNRAKEEYVIILSESKEDFQNMSLEKHSETTRGGFVKNLSQPQVTGPTKLSVNGMPALQYELRGGVNNLNVVYLHTTVESPKNFHQIIAWTLRSHFDQNKDELQRVINSFKER